MAAIPDDRNNVPDDDDFDQAALRQKKKSGNGPLIAMVVIGVLLVGGLIFALYYFLGGSGKFDTEMLAYLPADSTMLAGAEVEDLLKNSKIKDSFNKMAKKSGEDPFKEANDKLKPSGLTVDDISRVVMGGNVPMDKPTVVVRTKKSFEAAKMAQVFEATEEKKKGDKTYYQNRHGAVFYSPSDKLFVLTNDKQLDALLATDASKVSVSQELQELGKKMSKGQLWAVVSRKMVPEDFMKEIDEAKKGRVPYAPPELLDAIKDMKGAGFFVNIDGDTVKFGGGMLGGNQDLIEKAQAALKKEIDEQRGKKLEDNALIGKEFAQAPPAVKTFVSDLQKSVAVDRSGAVLEVSASFTVSGLETLVESWLGLQMVQDRHEAAQNFQQLKIEHDHDFKPLPPPKDYLEEKGPAKKANSTPPIESPMKK